MRGRLSKLLFAVTVGTLIGVASAEFVALQLRKAPLADVEGLLWPDPKAVQPFALVDHRGEPFTRRKIPITLSTSLWGASLRLFQPHINPMGPRERRVQRPRMKCLTFQRLEGLYFIMSEPKRRQKDDRPCENPGGDRHHGELHHAVGVRCQ